MKRMPILFFGAKVGILEVTSMFECLSRMPSLESTK
jgi:hypothetical protein